MRRIVFIDIRAQRKSSLLVLRCYPLLFVKGFCAQQVVIGSDYGVNRQFSGSVREADAWAIGQSQLSAKAADSESDPDIHPAARLPKSGSGRQSFHRNLLVVS